EFVRPYLIARRVNATMASQVAIWLVERVFDSAAVVLLFTLDVFTSRSLRELDRYQSWRGVAYIMAPVVLLFTYSVWALWARGPQISAWICRRLAAISGDFSSRFEKKLRSVSEGLHTIKDGSSLIQVAALSVLIWVLIALAYRAVTHAFPAYTDLPSLNFPEVILLMFVSVAGGVITLPVVGGGSQLATIAVLSQTFGYSDTPELAVACGMLLWLVTFMSIIPGGLILARREHISLRRLETEAGEEAKIEDAAGPGLPLP
ncbi:MAG: flippase-like domain-containing protein, partial [Acidobacteria bacterium]|nr:flippase-like domain-containing protein [Acidobacteriota bacterium]